MLKARSLLLNATSQPDFLLQPRQRLADVLPEQILPDVVGGKAGMLAEIGV